ncbi:hypothetical protein H5410_000569 [Solanum commersonii]|uniref:Uncharacterized protein n=1 Tax=Solanum commersonii TaxID=4109 RepID=A0A9J6AWL2_SOLCO|nr:hypothetical protein H5410_000569 [Solanum commersonii]
MVFEDGCRIGTQNSYENEKAKETTLVCNLQDSSLLHCWDNFVPPGRVIEQQLWISTKSDSDTRELQNVEIQLRHINDLTRSHENISMNLREAHHPIEDPDKPTCLKYLLNKNKVPKEKTEATRNKSSFEQSRLA